MMSACSKFAAKLVAPMFPDAIRQAHIPAQILTIRMGAQMPTQTFGRGPFQAGGGGGGGAGGGRACGGGACAAATHMLDGASYWVPSPHWAALLTAGHIEEAITASAKAAGTMSAKRFAIPNIRALRAQSLPPRQTLPQTRRQRTRFERQPHSRTVVRWSELATPTPVRVRCRCTRPPTARWCGSGCPAA